MMKRAAVFLLLALLAALPLATASEYYLNVVVLVCLYVVLSQSWNALGGYCGQISLGHSAFFGIGALAFRFLWLGGFPYYVALPAGAVAALALASVIGFSSLKLKGHYFSIGTLALAMIATITVRNVLPGVSFITPACLGQYSLRIMYYLALTSAAASVFVIRELERSRLGLAMISVREEEEASEAIGINTIRTKIVAMSISTFMAGFAGGLFAFYCGTFYYYAPFELDWSFDPLLITFIGGAGTVAGPVIGSVVFVTLKEIFAAYLGQVDVLIFGAVFIVAVLFFPQGLVGIGAVLRRARKVTYERRSVS